MNNCQEENLKLKFVYYRIFKKFPKMIKTVFNFLLCTGENIFLGGFSSVFAVKQATEQILFQVQPLQM